MGEVLMFAGLDDIDWGSLSHAYGSAEDVPELVRDLVSPDPATREIALDAMHGGVHHQGDVYDSTLAVIPFLLEAVAVDGLSGRGGILRLLAGIGSAESGKAPEKAPYSTAAAAVGEAYPLLVRLLADPDREVREAVPKTLTACRAEATAVVAALWERVDVETDVEVRIAVIAAIGAFGRRADGGAETAAGLKELVAGPGETRVRLVALTEYLGCGPTDPPPDVVTTAADLLTAAYAADVPEPEPVGFSTNTLASFIREARAARGDTARRTPHSDDSIIKVSGAFGDRLRDRTRLAHTLFASDDEECRHDAVIAARQTIAHMRGDHRELVAAIGARLLDQHPRVRYEAAYSLNLIDELAAPVADELAAAVDGTTAEAAEPAPDGASTTRIILKWNQRAFHPAVEALARIRDGRVLPLLEWALRHEEMPDTTGTAIGGYGPATAHLVPLIRQRLNALPADQALDSRHTGLVEALGKIGPAAADAVPDLLAMTPKPEVLRALARMGPAAGAAVPTLRSLLDDDHYETAIRAAAALWHIDGDPSVILPTLDRHLDSDVYAASAALETMATIGPAAAAYEPRLRLLLDRPVEHGWLPLHTAQALWRTTADTSTTVPVLVDLWPVNAYLLPHIVSTFAEMGPAAAPAEAVLRAELAYPRRRRLFVGWDEELLRSCATALAAIA